MDKDLKQFDQAIIRLTKASSLIPTRAATVAVNFVKERFRAQNWLDESPEPWKKRRSRKGSKPDRRAVLVKSGRLMRSWRKISANSDRAIIGSDVPYARIHNDGGQVKAVANVGSYTKKSYTRKAHSRTRKGVTEQIKATTINSHTVKAHRREINFTMQKRQFIGNSATLNNRIQEMITNDIEKAIKQP